MNFIVNGRFFIGVLLIFIFNCFDESLTIDDVFLFNDINNCKIGQEYFNIDNLKCNNCDKNLNLIPAINGK